MSSETGTCKICHKLMDDKTSDYCSDCLMILICKNHEETKKEICVLKAYISNLEIEMKKLNKNLMRLKI